jgi:predicted MFS family arabinose efflux permease
MPKARTSGESVAALSSIFFVGISSVMVAGLKPMLVTLYVTKLQLSISLSGFILGAEMIGAACGAAAVSALIPRIRGRHLAFTAMLMMLCSDLVSTLSLQLVELVVVRVVAGLSAGLAAGVMVATLSGMRAPDRLMGLYNTIALLVLAVAFAVAPYLTELWGIKALFFGLAATTVPALLLCPWFPNHNATTRHDNQAPSLPPVPLRAATIGLLGTASFYLALGGLWPFMGEIGRHTGLSAQRVAQVLSAAQIAAAVGAVLPTIVGQRFGRQVPFAVAIGISTLGLVALLVCFGSPATFQWAAPVFLGGAMMQFGYLMGIMAGVDAFGRVSSLSISVQTAGFGFGPVCAGLLVTRAGYPAALWAAILCMPLTLGFLLPLARQQDARRRAVSPNLPAAFE